MIERNRIKRLRSADDGGRHAPPAPSFMTRLARNESGNVLAMMAASILPLAGVIGGAVDMSRLYITKTRLQHACDAGALAGRRMMGAGRWSDNSNAANTEALRYFDANFQQGAFGTGTRTRAFTESNGKVTGVVTAQVPMTLMKIFQQGTQTVEVECDAEMRLPNTDVMFVLDTTGSMQETIPGDSARKINTLKFAVKCFYEQVARLDTNADCTPGTPGPTTGLSNVQVRFGFVPYATNVNVGRLLPTSHIADEWPYQSREALWWNASGSPTTTEHPVSMTGVPQSYCNNTVAATLDEDTFQENGSTATLTQTRHRVTGWTWPNGGTCSGIQRRIVTNFVLSTTVSTRFARWRYARVTHNISGLKSGANWNPGVSLRLGADGAETTIPWDGCIEERATVRQSNYWPLPTDALDLNIDLVPATTTPGSFWGPALPGAVFTRDTTNRNDAWDFNMAEVVTTANYANPSYECPEPSRKLQIWPSTGTGTTTLQGYVDSLTTGGNTYHDIGLLWGARLLSPNGIFASENALTPTGGDIERHLIFMTDGQTCTSETNYTAYGVEWFDRRRTSTSSAPSGGCSSSSNTGGTISQQVDARFPALCNAVKGMPGTTLWVVYFGTTDTATQTRMQNCASTNRFFYANNSAQLVEAFRLIAAEISQLRLTR